MSQSEGELTHVRFKSFHGHFMGEAKSPSS